MKLRASLYADTRIIIVASQTWGGGWEMNGALWHLPVPTDIDSLGAAVIQALDASGTMPPMEVDDLKLASPYRDPDRDVGFPDVIWKMKHVSVISKTEGGALDIVPSQRSRNSRHFTSLGPDRHLHAPARDTNAIGDAVLEAIERCR